ncbi:MAG: hypothetical protein IT392_04770 [Nitrospirae bacterium]|nr:hypothetical protein [Nitrospirota bacterium]
MKQSSHFPLLPPKALWKAPFIILFVVLILGGCAGKRIPLASQPEDNRTYKAPYGRVWDALTSLLTEENIAIETIDKNSGVVRGSKNTEYGGLDAVWGPYKNKFVLNIIVKSMTDSETTVSIRTNVEMCNRACKPDPKTPRATDYEIGLYNKLSTKL